ncbi:MAG: cytochrome c biogenesis protein CcdA, partial [Pirellulales bacterium]
MATSPAVGQLTLPGLGGQTAAAPSVQVEAGFTVQADSSQGTLVVQAKIASPFHIYSITQPAGGPQKTRIELEPSAHYRQTGPFQANPPPATHIDNEVWVGLRLEEHTGQVTWTAPMELAQGVNPKQLTITGNVDLQACDAGSCVPLKVPFAARLQQADQQSATEVADGAKALPPQKVATESFASVPPSSTPSSLKTPNSPVSVGMYAPAGGSVTIEGYLEPATVAPNGTTRLVITARPQAGWHIYAREDRDPKEISKPTLIVIDHPDGTVVYRATTDAEVTEKDQTDLGLGIDRYHEGPVTWTVPIEVPADARRGEHAIAGIIGYQICTDHGCKPPTAARFRATLTVGRSGPGERKPVQLFKATYREAALLAQDLPIPPPADSVQDNSFDLVESGENASLAWMLLQGFLGGLILNIMPCVLPVIGLKVMSFVEQSRHNRARALVLNIWYALGITSVFLLLAALAVVAGMTWGEHFGFDLFNITLAAIVFAMGLSLLGVWEIPIPGFVGGSRAADLSQQEGPGGAFLKGVITTVLATPCTGPLMGAALFWAVNQEPMTTFAVFGAMGVGMSTPYLIIGAFPELIRWLPKPGPWMVTFKQLMGFILLGTVIFLLTFIHPQLIVPTVTLLRRPYGCESMASR